MLTVFVTAFFGFSATVTNAQTASGCMSLTNNDTKMACLMSLITQLSEQLARLQPSATTQQITSQTSQQVAPQSSSQSSYQSWCYNFNYNFGEGTTTAKDPSLASDIASLKKVLQKQGLDTRLDASGTYGDATASAVCQLQLSYASQFLTPFGFKNCTGFVGTNTRAGLNNLYGCKVSASTAVSAQTTQPCNGTYLCTAIFGYDGPTGMGTPKGSGAFNY